jgi:hypothetical protein
MIIRSMNSLYGEDSNVFTTKHPFSVRLIGDLLAKTKTWFDLESDSFFE